MYGSTVYFAGTRAKAGDLVIIMTKSARLISLLIILGLGMLIAFLIGQDHPIPWKKTLSCPLYSVFKQGLIQFHFLLAHSLPKAIETILNLLESAKCSLFKN